MRGNSPQADRVAPSRHEGARRPHSRFFIRQPDAGIHRKSLEASSKRLLGTPEDVPADERAAEFKKCFVDVSATFKANTESTKIVKPRVSPFHNPSKFAEPTSMFGPALRDHGLDAEVPKRLTMRLGIIAAVGVDDFGLPKWPPAYAANRWNCLDQRQQLGDVVAVGAVRIPLTGTPLASTRIWCFEPGRARSAGFGPVFRPPQRLAPTTNPPQRGKNRAGRPRANARVAIRAAGPTRRPRSSRAGVASMSHLIRSRGWLAGGSNEALS